MRKRTKMNETGFTLIELMTAVAIIGILVAIVVLNFGDSVRRSNEKATIGDLRSIRGALSIYASDNNGKNADALTDLTSNGKYLRKIPPAFPMPHHPSNAAVLAASAADDAGGWIYDNSGSNPLMVNCTHTDSKGSIWTSF